MKYYYTVSILGFPAYRSQVKYKSKAEAMGALLALKEQMGDCDAVIMRHRIKGSR